MMHLAQRICITGTYCFIYVRGIYRNLCRPPSHTCLAPAPGRGDRSSLKGSTTGIMHKGFLRREELLFTHLYFHVA